MSDDYAKFLATKQLHDAPTGMTVPEGMLPDVLFDWQAALVQWALQRGRAALFTYTGTGKTIMQLSWAAFIPGPVLIFAPLAVTHQTIREAKSKLDLDIRYVRTPDEMGDGISITNYDRQEAFHGAEVQGIVLDESSILKSVTSTTRAAMLQHFAHIPYRLCCTATPAPNDIAEIANHAEFLGVMSRTGMLSTFFVHDQDGWRLRGHAREAFYCWLASWSMALRSPEDIGYDGSAFILPPLTIVPHFLPSHFRRDGELFAALGLKGITDRAHIRQQTAVIRAEYSAQLARDAEGSVLIWTGLNTESTLVTKALQGNSVCEVVGSDTPQYKEKALLDFADGQTRLLVSKSTICGYGMNFQVAHTAIFCGLSDSWESWFQAIRRLWRYGQTEPVTVHVVLTEHEKPIWENIQRKEAEAMALMDGLIEAMQRYEQEALRQKEATVLTQTLTRYTGPGWQLYHGDCIDGLAQFPENSLHLSIYSPPFLSLYQYSDTERDLGNCTSEEQFFTHHGYVARQLLRITMPGRLVAMHVSDVPAMQVRDGWIGLKNFSGHMIDHMIEQGWFYHGRYVVDKNPQAQAIRIRAKGLAFQQLHKDASWMRAALPDYVLLFRKPGDNPVPIVPDIDNETWIQWAYPVWYSTSRDPRGIRETVTLNAAEARDHDDDRHICPLALDLIERCIRLWSNPGETVCDPFSGLASVGYVALQHDRQFIGCELKNAYITAGLKNLARALTVKNQMALFETEA